MGHGKVKSRIRKGKSVKPRIYYDASALISQKRDIFDEIAGESIKKDILISYLALGEAYGSCCGDGEEDEEYFRQLFSKIRKFVKIVKNDVSTRLFDSVRSECGRIEICDALHLATAIYYKCEQLRTKDRDLSGIDKNKIKKLAKKYKIPNFAICETKE
ncbi:MAG: PIN domain-containing protein [Parcubacteria group bacterium]|nr:PIN domain-containing protein [Parcubacteria group bacterium]